MNTDSDHQTIHLDLRNRTRYESGKTRIASWSTGAFKEKIFLAILEGGQNLKETTLEK